MLEEAADACVSSIQRRSAYLKLDLASEQIVFWWQIQIIFDQLQRYLRWSWSLRCPEISYAGAFWQDDLLFSPSEHCHAMMKLKLMLLHGLVQEGLKKPGCREVYGQFQDLEHNDPKWHKAGDIR